MKRTISILLALLSMLMLLVGCGGGSTPKEEPAVETNVAKPLTMAEIDAIPIVSPDMTVDQLREIVCTFMRYQNSIPWTPSKKFEYYNNEKYNCWDVGTVGGGMPYIGSGQGSLYNYMHFYDERNGMLDIDAIEALKQPMYEIVTNQCSGSTYWAWARVCNSTKMGYSPNMLPTNGYLPLPLGTYYVDPKLTAYNDGLVKLNTADVCVEHGEQKIFEGYACLLPADGLVHFLGERGGHVMMSSSKAVVVKKADGTIDGEKSYVTILDQTMTRHPSTQENGIKIDTLGGVDTKMTFKQLFKGGYLPFTLPEFVGQDPVEKSETTSSHTKDTITYKEFELLKVKSNYPISYVTVTVKNSKGKVLYSEHVYSCAMNVFEMKALNNLALDTTELRSLANGKNTIEVSARIGTGEVPVVYTGTFTK